MDKYLKALEEKIQAAYEAGTTPSEAETLAGEFLRAQMLISGALKNADLDARMRKTGVKAIRAAIYLDVVSKNEKKPTEAGIAAMIDTNELVAGEQKDFDMAEVERDSLTRYYNIAREAHIYFRGIGKGKFE